MSVSRLPFYNFHQEIYNTIVHPNFGCAGKQVQNHSNPNSKSFIRGKMMSSI